MNTYVVLEKVPDTVVNGQSYHQGVPDFMRQLVTVVEAESPKDAVDFVMAATRVSFTSDIDTSSSADGLLKRKAPEGAKQLKAPEGAKQLKAPEGAKQLKADVDRMARESDEKLARLERELDALRDGGS